MDLCAVLRDISETKSHPKVEIKHNLFYCTSLYCPSEMFHFSQIKGKSLYQQRDYDSLYCDN